MNIYISNLSYAVNDGDLKDLFGEYGEADPYYILADFPSYIETYEKVYHLYVDHKDEWIKKAIVNTAKSGYFSSDRTIEQYNEKIWNLKPVKELQKR